MKVTRSQFSKKVFIATALALVGVVSASCTKRQAKLEYDLNPAETLVVNIQTEPPSLDPSKATDTTSAEVLNNIMAPLIQFDTADPSLKLIPSLLTAWEPSEKATKWKLTVRQGVVWSDGQPFTAQQILDGWERLLNPATASEYAYFLFSIKGAQDYNKGTIKDFSQVAAKIVDPNTIEVQLNKSKGYFPMLLTHHSTLPIRKDVIEKHGPRWTEAANIVTLGPFTLKVWDHDKAIVLERNEKYFGEKTKLKNVLMRMINDTSTALNLFDSGKIDFLPELPSTELPVLSKRPEFHREPNLVLQYYGFNTKKAPMDNLKLRQAIAHAINKQEIVDMLAGGQTPVSGWFPKGIMGFTQEGGLKFDPERAKQLLKEAGYEDPKKVPRITLAFNTNDNHRRIAENVQAQIKRNLGIEIEVKNEEWKVYLKTLQADPPQIFRMGWQADYPDPDNFINLMTSYSENNRTKWGNPEFDKLVEEGAGELDPAKRQELYVKAQKILIEQDTAVVPLFTGVSNTLLSKRVENFPYNILALRVYDKVTIKK